MENQEVSITLTVAGWNAVLTVLGQRPYAEVAGLIEAIRGQASQQITVPAQPQAEISKSED